MTLAPAPRRAGRLRRDPGRRDSRAHLPHAEQRPGAVAMDADRHTGAELRAEWWRGGLMTSSILVDCWTGRSVGAQPQAARRGRCPPCPRGRSIGASFGWQKGAAFTAVSKRNSHGKSAWRRASRRAMPPDRNSLGYAQGPSAGPAYLGAW